MDAVVLDLPETSAAANVEPVGVQQAAARVVVDGKFFAAAGERFHFRGVTYGTFRPRESDGARFPERDQIASDFAAMRAEGFTVVRTYTPPPDDLVALAGENGLRVLAGIFYPDWRYVVGFSRKARRKLVRDARAEVEVATRRLAGNPTILAVSLGNEVPADALRWFGTSSIARVIGDLADLVRSIDPDMLVTYANYPTAEYLPLDSLDFLTFNVFLERRDDFRKYLTRLHNLAGDRPLVLGEVGLHSGIDAVGEARQAEVLDWQLEVAIERGVAGMCLYSWTDEWHVGENEITDWNFGLTRRDRAPKPALAVARTWNARSVRDLPGVQWPSISVVVCAYNGAATVDECLEYTCALDYPNLEIILVDDGSTDDTAEIGRRHSRARVLSIPHEGLSVARNAGYLAATGDLVAYLDSDAFPTPEWPYFLALGMDSDALGGVGGPNIPPPSDGLGAKQVAQAPGGPVHVLTADDRAEHIPGCNMTFRREVLAEVGGFNPIYMAAGDDVDFCWRVLDAGWEIGFHPAALVWHHRRSGIRTYLRQQKGYGRSEALVAARHPARFTAAGTASWRGRIYNSAVPSGARQRVYRGEFGAAAYQSVYQAGGHGLDIAHQLGIPLALATFATMPAVVLSPWLGLPALAALAFVLTLAGIDVGRARAPRQITGRLARARFRLGVAVMHVAQPVVRIVSRARHREVARQGLPEAHLDGPVTSHAGGVLLIPATAERAQIAAEIVQALRMAGLPLLPTHPWQDYDARVLGSAFVQGDVVTSAHTDGVIQLAVRRHPRWWPVTVFAVVLAATAVASLPAAAVLVAVGMAEAGRGLVRTGPTVRRVVRAAAGGR